MSLASPRVDVVTLGCRLNIVESDEMRRLAERAGRDTIIVNTCAVTAEAERRSRQAVRRALRDNTEAQIVVSGCASEIARDEFAGLSERVEILPNAAKADAQIWDAIVVVDPPSQGGRGGERMRAGEGRISRALHYASDGLPPRLQPTREGRPAHTRGFVAVQNGCDHRCTFCVIPFGRGASRSLPGADVVAKVRALVAQGHADVILTGVDLTSWGLDLGAGSRLGDLVKMILRDVPDLARLRLSSLDCIEADDALLDAFASEERLMPHLHLSLQSGDDLILKRMKRRHSRADAARFCDRLRTLRPDIVFGADLIAGFPTETGAMFANTLALADDCGLTHLHVFPYSPRPGTPAARMPAVPAPLVAERAARLRETGVRRLARHLDAQVGRTVEVLVERGAIGRMPDFTPVRVSPALVPGTRTQVTIVAHDGARLLAEPHRVAA